MEVAMVYVGYVLSAWAAISAVLNVILRFKTAAEWCAFVERRPRGAAAMRLLRAAGFDPIKTMQSIMDFVSKGATERARKISDRPPPIYTSDRYTFEQALEYARQLKKDDPGHTLQSHEDTPTYPRKVR